MKIVDLFNEIEIGPIKVTELEIPGKLIALAILAALIAFLAVICSRSFFAEFVALEGPDPYRIPKLVESEPFPGTDWMPWSFREAYGRLSTPV